MKRVTCSQCGVTVPMNDTFRLDEAVLCSACLERRCPPNQSLEDLQQEMREQLDPTICAECGQDNGVLDLPQIVGVPICDECGEKLRRFRYPEWVKVAMGVVLALTVVSFVRSAPYYRGHVAWRKATEAFVEWRFEDAANYSAAASEHVPDYAPFQKLAQFYRGAYLLQIEDKPKEALELILGVQKFYLEDRLVQAYVIWAEQYIAYQDKDYALFLKKAKAKMKLYPGDWLFAAQVASGHAYIYAATGDQRQKAECRKAIREAGKLAPQDAPAVAEYYQRIEHRLDTREIISGEEFRERFPDGYKKEGQ